jgi:two-component system phosphate regulon response regulator PhoB
MAKEHILVVDDEEDILALINFNLSKEGYKVTCVASGEMALSEARSTHPDLIILDLMLPGVDGLDVCRRLQMDEATRGIPIVMLTAKGEEADIVAGLELGADDYITKPFSPRVLMARLKAVLRRSAVEPAAEGDVISVGPVTIDPGRHLVTVDNAPVELTLTEFRIIHSLARRPGWVFTRYQIVESTRGEDSEVTDRSVDVHIVALRKKLGRAGALVETVRGLGYRFKETE